MSIMLPVNADLIILGGGMVGQLAKFLFPHAVVLDWRPVPPRDKHLNGAKQFGAQYLWKPLQGIECRELDIVTTIDGAEATMDAIVRYKTKIHKPSDLGRSDEEILAQFPFRSKGYQIVSLPRADIQWGVYIDSIDLKRKKMVSRNHETFEYGHLISTIPLPALLDMFKAKPVGSNHHRPDFVAKSICVKTGPIPPDAPDLPDAMVRINYISDLKIAAYRTTDRERQRHYEWLRDSNADMGIPSKVITPGKIWAHPESENWVRFLSQHCDIHCFGRFPTWRPDELLHETYEHLLEFKRSLEG